MAKIDADHKDKLSSKRTECRLWVDNGMLYIRTIWNQTHITYSLQSFSKREFEKWCVDREKDLLKIEDAELKQAEEVMKSKINADMDRIAKKLYLYTRVVFER